MSTVAKKRKATSKKNLAPNTPVEELHRVFELQKKNAQNVRNLKIYERRDLLKRLELVILEKREQIQDAVRKDYLKPKDEVDFSEIYRALSEIRNNRKNLRKWSKPKSVETPLALIGTSSAIYYEPKGTVLIISPWNYPFQLCIIPIVSAVAAGNTVILKPSEFTPNTSVIIKEILDAVFEEDHVAVLDGDHTVTQELLKLKFDHIFFTGSPEVGKIVMRAAADHLTPVTLELGGKSPTIVDETANISKAASRITFGKWLNCGQTCIAPDYLLVHEDVKDQLLAELKKNIEKFFGATADERKNSEDYSRIINKKHHDRLTLLMEDAVEKGAKVYFGGAADVKEQYLEPTIFTNVDPESELMKHEIFGPLLPVLTYKNLDETLKIINEREKPLAMYIFSNRKENISKVLRYTSAGGTVINDTLTHEAHANLPFGGVNHSGTGQAHGYFGFKAFSHERAVVKQVFPMNSAMNFYPPYTPFRKWVIDKIIKWL